LLAPEDRVDELGSIFTVARRNNRGLGITGALLITEHGFAQTLEGDEPAVRELFGRIERDPRHARVHVLEEGPADGRVFGRWAMAKVASEDGPDIRMVSNAARGKIVAAGRDTHVTPEQERIVGFMRESLLQTEPRPV
jgi:predicted sulfurtransferase